MLYVGVLPAVHPPTSRCCVIGKSLAYRYISFCKPMIAGSKGMADAVFDSQVHAAMLLEQAVDMHKAQQKRR